MTWLMWLMSTSEKCNKLSRVINVIYDAARGRTPSCGREEAEEVESRGREWGWEGEIEWEGTRGETETSHHNKTSPTNKQVELQAGFSPSLPAWLLSSSKFNSVQCKVVVSEAEGAPRWRDGAFNKDQENIAVSFYTASCDDGDTSW